RPGQTAGTSIIVTKQQQRIPNPARIENHPAVGVPTAGTIRNNPPALFWLVARSEQELPETPQTPQRTWKSAAIRVSSSNIAMWQAFVPASDPENGADGARKEGRNSSKKRQRADFSPGDGQAVASMYGSIVRPGVPHRRARGTGTVHDEYDKFNGNDNFSGNDNFIGKDKFNGNDNFNGHDNFNGNNNFNGNANFNGNDNFNGNANFNGNDSFNGNKNGNFNSNGNKNGRSSSGTRRLKTERPPASSPADEEEEEQEEHATAGLTEAAIFGPAPNPNLAREY
ncbi:unnamed protein product, partial [Laminaria digitata]